MGRNRFLVQQEGLPDEANLLWAIAWCRRHNARVRFWSNGTVSVHVNYQSARRATLPIAAGVLAERIELPGTTT